jgi:transposase-like protein
MDQAEGLVPERRVRRWRSVAEKRRIVELTLVPGASVALVARAHGVNANQVFKWRGEFERGELSEHLHLCFRWCYLAEISRRRALDTFTSSFRAVR